LRFAEGYYRESARSATVGAFFITKRLTVPSVGLTCKIQIWDTAGQEQFKPLAPMYYSSAAAAIVCYDPSNAKSLQTLNYWLDELHKNVPAGRIVIALAACKCDLLSAATAGGAGAGAGGNNNVNSATTDNCMTDNCSSANLTASTSTIPVNNTSTNNTAATAAAAAVAEKQAQAAVSLQQVEEMAQQMGAIFVPTSAKTNENVTELFSMVAERVLQFQKQQQTYNKNHHGSSNNASTTTIPVTLGGTNHHHHDGSGSTNANASRNNGMLAKSPKQNQHQTIGHDTNININTNTTASYASTTYPQHVISSQRNHYQHTSTNSSNDLNNISQEEYDEHMHRRSHHHHHHHHHHPNNNHNNSNNNNNFDYSPTRYLSKTSALGMNGGPILTHPPKQQVQQQQPQHYSSDDVQKTASTSNSGGIGIAGFAASATMCGDADYLTCAGLPERDENGKCIIS